MNLESLFGDSNFDMECSSCNHQFSVKFNQVMKDNSIVQCPDCHVDIKVEHDTTTQNTLRDGQKSLKDFEKTLKKFGK